MILDVETLEEIGVDTSIMKLPRRQNVRNTKRRSTAATTHLGDHGVVVEVIQKCGEQIRGKGLSRVLSEVHPRVTVIDLVVRDEVAVHEPPTRSENGVGEAVERARRDAVLRGRQDIADVGIT
ncbi:MAG: hypothetical protein B7Z74_11200 [Deltaproteobacteria bacterium 21-66-5]|nr:MAG: hypothetical protein B7Z74_11200 [Deltaproteobacteria bacterium 21-66-5]